MTKKKKVESEEYAFSAAFICGIIGGGAVFADLMMGDMGKHWFNVQGWSWLLVTVGAIVVAGILGGLAGYGFAELIRGLYVMGKELEGD